MPQHERLGNKATFLKVYTTSRAGMLIVKCIAMQRAIDAKKNRAPRKMAPDGRNESYRIIDDAFYNHFRTMLHRCRKVGVDPMAVIAESDLVIAVSERQKWYEKKEAKAAVPRTVQSKPGRPRVDGFGS